MDQDTLIKIGAFVGLVLLYGLIWFLGHRRIMIVEKERVLRVKQYRVWLYRFENVFKDNDQTPVCERLNKALGRLEKKPGGSDYSFWMGYARGVFDMIGIEEPLPLVKKD